MKTQLTKKEKNQKKFDVIFHDDENSNSKGFRDTYEECFRYIQSNNGTMESYFADYKGGSATIYDTEKCTQVYEEYVR